MSPCMLLLETRSRRAFLDARGALRVVLCIPPFLIFFSHVDRAIVTVAGDQHPTKPNIDPVSPTLPHANSS